MTPSFPPIAIRFLDRDSGKIEFISKSIAVKWSPDQVDSINWLKKTD
jgi:hypothetical protein